MGEIESKVIGIVAQILDVAPQELDPDMMMGDIDQWDSLSHTLIIIALEREYNVVFDLDQVVDVDGITDLVDLVERVNGRI